VGGWSVPRPKTGFTEFFESLELLNIALVQTSAWRSEDFVLPAKVNMDHEVSVKILAPGKWVTVCKYDLTAIVGGGDEPGLRISASYSASYSAEGELDDQARKFLTDNATLATWPYMRHYVRSITSEMGLNPLTIGLFKVTFQPPGHQEPKQQGEPLKATARSRSVKKK